MNVETGCTAGKFVAPRPAVNTGNFDSRRLPTGRGVSL